MKKYEPPAGIKYYPPVAASTARQGRPLENPDEGGPPSTLQSLCGGEFVALGLGFGEGERRELHAPRQQAMLGYVIKLRYRDK